MLIRVILKELTFVDGPDPELPLDGGDEGRALEDGAGEGLEGAGDLGDVGDGGVEAGDADILLAGTLLGFDEAGGSVDADDEVAGDFGVEGTAVSGFFDTEDALDPCDNLVGGRVGGLVEVEDTVLEVFGEGSLERGVTGGDRGVVSGADVEAVVVLKEDWPFGGVYGGSEALWFDHEVLALFFFCFIMFGVLLLLGVFGEGHGFVFRVLEEEKWRR